MKRTTIIGAVFALFAIISGILYMNTREKKIENGILVKYQDEELTWICDSNAYCDVKGKIINGKGEVTKIDTKGIPLIIYTSTYQDTDYKQVTVIADDAYQAVITREEVETDEKVYLLVEDDTYNLVVFGDPDSKRNVRNVIKLVVE